MRGLKIFAVLSVLPLITQAANIVLSNDDGWAEINIRTLFDILIKAGENVVLSAPAENKSGSGSLDAPPTKLTKPCEFNSCPIGSPPYGNNASNHRLNYVNSYPATSMRYGIKNLSTPLLGGPPDLALSGFNVGANIGLATFASGTVGAACEAVKLGYPAIALSGSTGSQTAWNAQPSTYQSVYADLSLNITQTILASGAPYLPSGIWLNVNFSPVSGGKCTNPGDFGFVLSRIHTNLFGGDVEICDNGGFLPTESTVMKASGCWASVSVAIATTKLDAGITDQVIVLSKLREILTCLPSQDHLSEMTGEFGDYGTM